MYNSIIEIKVNRIPIAIFRVIMRPISASLKDMILLIL